MVENGCEDTEIRLSLLSCIRYQFKLKKKAF